MFYWKLFVSPSPFTSLTTTGVHARADYLKKHPEWWLYSNASPMPDYLPEDNCGCVPTQYHGMANQECALMPQVKSILTWVVFFELLNIKQRTILPCGWYKLLYSCSCRTVALLNDVWLNSTVVWKHLAFLTLFCTDFSRGQGFIHQMLLKGRIVSALGLDLYMCGTLYHGVWKP